MSLNSMLQNAATLYRSKLASRASTQPNPPGGAGSGLFSDPYVTSYTPNPAGPYSNSISGPYDISGITSSANRLSSASPFQKTAFTPFNFTAPSLSTTKYKTLGPRAGLGSYGRTSDEELSKVGELGLNAGLRPIRSQSEERMRMATQGFGNNLRGPALQELILKNAMKTGEDISGVGSDIASMIAGTKLQEGQTARSAEWADKSKVAQDYWDQMMEANKGMFADEAAVKKYNADANMTTQEKQAAENMAGANFGFEQNKYASDDQLARDKAYADAAFKWLEEQVGLNQQEASAWQNVMGYIGGMSGTSPAWGG